MREGVLAGISTGKGAVKIICDLQTPAPARTGNRKYLFYQIIFTGRRRRPKFLDFLNKITFESALSDCCKIIKTIQKEYNLVNRG